VYDLLIGLNQADIEALCGDVLTFARHGLSRFRGDSDIAITFAQPNEEPVEKRMPPPADMASNTRQ